MFGFLVNPVMWFLIIAGIFGVIGFFVFESIILGFLPFITTIGYLSIEGYLQAWWLYALLLFLIGGTTFIWVIPALTIKGGDGER